MLLLFRPIPTPGIQVSLITSGHHTVLTYSEPKTLNGFLKGTQRISADSCDQRRI